MSSLQTLLNLINFDILCIIFIIISICNGYVKVCHEDECANMVIKCPKKEKCEIKCMEPSSCEQANFKCSEGNECIIHCIGDYACFHAEADAKYASKLRLIGCSIGDKTCVGFGGVAW